MVAPHVGRTRTPSTRASTAAARSAWRLPAWRDVPADERFNVGTALAGLVGMCAAGAWLATQATSGLARAAVAFYGASFALMFLATALHHAYPADERLRRLDHASIYLAILGIAAPVCLVLVGGRAGWLAFAATALLTAGGIAMKLVGPFLAPARNLWLYVPAPLPVLAALREATAAIAGMALALLAAALALFVGGALVDATERPDPPSIRAHGIFHLCVLAGSALAFAFVAGAMGAST